MTQLYSIEELQKRTSLKYDYIRKCLQHLKKIIKPKRWVSNSLMFDDNAMLIFDKIAQKKNDEWWTINEIVEYIRTTIQTTENEVSKGIHSEHQSDTNTVHTKQISNSAMQILKLEHDNEIKDLTVELKVKEWEIKELYQKTLLLKSWQDIYSNKRSFWFYTSLVSWFLLVLLIFYLVNIDIINLTIKHP